MSNEHLHLAIDDGVAIITVDRPKRRNALHGPLWTALGDMGTQLAKDPPRAVILTGANGHFCSGMDLRADNPLAMELMSAIMQDDEPALRKLILGLKANLAALAELPCPVIAAIEGACFGGGLELALTADLRIAASSATLSMPETRWGMVPDVGGTTRLTRLVGRSRASDLILTGRTMHSDEALSWGLVNRVVDDGQALEAARQMAGQIRLAAPIATRAALGALRQVHTLSDVDAFAAETDAGVQALRGKEPMEGLTAFMQKRAPAWAN